MKKGIYILPNLITMGNMFCGFYAILAAFNHLYEISAIAIIVAGIFDFMDGKVARITNTSSEFGIQFDSLSDLLSFGVAPAVLIYAWALKPFGRIGWAAAFLFVICGALRLARFNIQVNTAESSHFTGLPIPAAAGVLITMVLIYYRFWEDIPEKSLFVMLVTYFSGFLMVSSLKYRSLKEIDFKKRHPFSILVAASLFLFVLASEPQITLFVIGFSYALSCPLKKILGRLKVTKPKLQAENIQPKHQI
jgi:CDP-diacylglycerol--serine O-phosphatidyltransferase